MADEFTAGVFTYESIEEALERLQSILLQRVEGRPDREVESEYRSLRRAPMAEPDIRERLPRLVTVNTDLGGVWSILKEESDQWEPRRAFVRQQMRHALEFVYEGRIADPTVLSSQWTGISSPRERLAVARQLLPLARASVEGLIAELERPQGNYGPPLEDRADALQNLKALHQILGELIHQLDQTGKRSINQRLMDEAASYISRAAKSLKDDPMPYIVSAMLTGIFAALGGGALGGYLAGVAANIRKNSN